MATAFAFDTLAFSKKLMSAGFTEKQAETQVEIMKTVMDENLATKKDVTDLKQDIGELKRDLKEMELRLIIKVGAMLAATIAVIAALVKLL